MKITQQMVCIPLEGDRPFNRYTLLYTATVPLRCVLTYREDTAEIQEDFFLEVGNGQTFSSYIDNYLVCKQADSVCS